MRQYPFVQTLSPEPAKKRGRAINPTKWSVPLVAASRSAVFINHVEAFQESEK